MSEKKEEDAIIGFLHNVSPIKKSARTPYFDMQIQTSSDVMRGVFALHQHGNKSSSSWINRDTHSPMAK